MISLPIGSGTNPCAGCRILNDCILNTYESEDKMYVVPVASSDKECEVIAVKFVFVCVLS